MTDSPIRRGKTDLTSDHLDPMQIKALVQGSMRADLHWFPEDVPPGRLAAVLVGMANSSGGTILLGVAPRSGHIQGVINPSEALDRVFQAALLAEPPLVLPIPRLAPVESASILVVSVPPGLPNVYALQGRYLGRDGTQSNPLSARRLRQLLVERGVLHFESQTPPGASFDDLDPEQVGAYLQALNLTAQIPAEETLLRRGCLVRSPDGLQPTHAALLLFGKYPQQWLPSATILAARFAGPTFSDHFIKQELRGTLPQQLRQAEVFLHENMRQVVRLVGLARQETSEWPFEAVRELLVNAVAHRDYNQQGDTIHLNVFSDRLEVHSPGGLPGPVTLQNLLVARFSRNAVVTQVLSDLGFVERLGYGLDRVVAVMRQAGLRPPRFEDVAGSFRVTLYAESPVSAVQQDLSAYRDLELNPRQEAALGFLARNRRITNSDYQELCAEVHPETLRRDLADLVARGVLIKVGDKRATYYILK